MSDIPEGYKMSEVGVIPEEWDVKSLKSILKLKSGFAFSSDYFSDSGPIVLTPGNFKLEGGLYFNNKNTKRYSGSFSSTMQFGYDDLLIVMTDLTPECNLLGKPAFVDSNEIILHNQRIGKVELIRKHISKKYLFYIFLSRKYLSKIKETATGSTVRHTSNKSIYDVHIPLPPLPEQQAIASALSDVDALITALEQLITKKRNIKQGVMQQLLTGKKRLPGFGGAWEVKKLGEIVEIRKGQLITENTRIEGNIPVIAGGKKPSYYHNKPNRLNNTITISGSGANAGYISYFETPIFASDCSTIEEGKGYSIKFIFYQLQLRQDKIYKIQTGGAQPHIHPSDLYPLEMPYLQPDEQQAIAQILSDMDTEIESLEQKQAKYKAIKQGMMQELLTGKRRLA